MAERVVDFLEPVQIDPMQSKSVSRLRTLQGVLQRFAKMQAVGDLRKWIVPSQPIDLLLGLAALGDVFLNIDPTAFRQRLICHQDHASAFQMLRVRECLALRELRNVALNPGALLLALVRSVAARLLLDVMADQFGEGRSGARQPLWQGVHLAIGLVADDKALFGVEHRQAPRHIVERDVEPAIELLEFLLVPGLVGFDLERIQSAPELGDFPAAKRRWSSGRSDDLGKGRYIGCGLRSAGGVTHE